jgi:stearoyl-CoA desaturase (delta-9 desaturase)
MKNILFTKFCQLAGYISLVFLIFYSINYGIEWFVISFLYYKIVVGLLGNQIAQHRYFSHKGFVTGPRRHKLLTFASLLTGISPIVYASIHRHHHVHSDTLEDPHSPVYSFWNSFIGWTFKFDLKVKPAMDLLKDKYVVYMHKNFVYIISTLLLLTFLINWKIPVFVILAGMGWNSLHMGLFRSVLVHTKIPGSYRNFETSDRSWNNKFLQILDIGEGLHNNHHRYPVRYDQAVESHEFDPAGWIVRKLFSKE